MKQLSIIIPSYNCSRWLERAVRSTQHLGVQFPEVFIIDDGSTDDTPDLGTRLAAEIPRVRYLRKENGGLSSARNFGMERASGEYILLLDADDELMPCNLALLLAQGIDVIRIGVEEANQDSQSTILHQEECPIQSGRSYLRTAFDRNYFYTPSWAYLYRRGFLVKHSLEFMPKLLHEDNLFTIQALMLADSMLAIPDLVYRYIRRDDSITTAVSRSKLFKRIHAYCLISSELTKIANNTPDFDLRWKIDEVIWGAFYLGKRCGGIRSILPALIAQIVYMARYRGYNSPGIRYGQRQRLKLMLKAIWFELTNQPLRF